MVMDKHICPYGLKSRELLKSEGYEIEDHHLTTRAETDAFKKEHDVETTPQTFINYKRIGGYDALREYFDKDKGSGKNYQPIIAVFSVTFLMAVAASLFFFGAINIIKIVEFFIAFSMCVLGILKLQDLESFSLQFLNYDLLAQRFVKYAYIYPFGEAIAGIGMISGYLPWLFASVALFIGSVGAVSVFKAVYIDKRELKCACVGGNSKVPLGFVSLTENLMMGGMAIWMFISM
jgi:glutaredoxin